MNNFEYLKTLSLHEAGHFMCDTIDELAPEEDYVCECCPFSDKCCKNGSALNGWIKWLREEHIDE